jgi:hypothetical protein
VTAVFIIRTLRTRRSSSRHSHTCTLDLSHWEKAWRQAGVAAGREPAGHSRARRTANPATCAGHGDTPPYSVRPQFPGRRQIARSDRGAQPPDLSAWSTLWQSYAHIAARGDNGGPLRPGQFNRHRRELRMLRARLIPISAAACSKRRLALPLVPARSVPSGSASTAASCLSKTPRGLHRRRQSQCALPMPSTDG